MMHGRFETDEDFAREYRDYKLDDLVNYIALWADRSYVTNVTLPDRRDPAQTRSVLQHY